MDFIVKLPPSEEPSTRIIYDSIMVIVDRLTKYAIFVPFMEEWSADQLGYVILDRLVRNHGIPKETISDRDKLFKSAYWQTLLAQAGVKQKMSTAYHPETNGQTERTNQTLKTYLRCYVNDK